MACLSTHDMAMDQYLYIPILGDEHPFTSYFDVHQGDRVLTHPRPVVILFLAAQVMVGWYRPCCALGSPGLFNIWVCLKMSCTPTPNG